MIIPRLQSRKSDAFFVKDGTTITFVVKANLEHPCRRLRDLRPKSIFVLKKDEIQEREAISLLFFSYVHLSSRYLVVTFVALLVAF